MEGSAKKKQAIDTFIPISLLSKSYTQVIQSSCWLSKGNSCNSLASLEFLVYKRELYVHDVVLTQAK